MKYTAIWQSDGYYESNWLSRLFEPYIAEHVFDGKHELVLENAIVFDSFLHSRNPAYYAAFRGRNAFLVHLSDETYEGGYDAYRNFRGVFRNYWSAMFDPSGVLTLPLGLPNSEPYTGPVKSASARPWLWSFLGMINKASRPDMFHAMKSLSPSFTFITDRPNDGKPVVPMTRPECDQVLRDSVFIPCPMGNVNLESWRVYEALQAGCIPILERHLTLDYFKGLLGNHPLPTFPSWPVARRAVEALTQEPARLDALQQQCAVWWKNYPAHLTESIGEFLDRRSQSASTVVPLRSGLTALRLWKYVELTRHHNAGALRRRIQRNLARVLKNKRWRLTTDAGKVSTP